MTIKDLVQSFHYQLTKDPPAPMASANPHLEAWKTASTRYCRTKRQRAKRVKENWGKATKIMLIGLF